MLYIGYVQEDTIKTIKLKQSINLLNTKKFIRSRNVLKNFDLDPCNVVYLVKSKQTYCVNIIR